MSSFTCWLCGIERDELPAAYLDVMEWETITRYRHDVCRMCLRDIIILRRKG